MIMKKILILAILTIATFSNAIGQSKLSDGDVLGTWKMVIELDEVLDDLKKEAEESETLIAEVIMKSVSGIVEGVMDRVQIYIDLERGGKATVRVNAFEEDSDDEDTKWYIKSGRLYIENTDNFDSDVKGNWYMRDGVLFLDDDDNDKTKIYMVRVKD
jgi:hypothetical protein